MNKISSQALLVLALSFLCTDLISQKKYWVKFKDKNGTPYTVSNPSAFLSPKSIARRTPFNVAINQTDLPVTPAYIAQVDAVSNVQVIYASKWLNGVVIATNDQNSLNTIKNMSFVFDTSRVNRYKLDYGGDPALRPSAQAEQNTSSGTSSAYNYGSSYKQNHQVGVDCLHSLGLRGTGIQIAVMDVGFYNVDTDPLFDSIRNRGRILGTYDFVSNEHNVYDNGTHGTSVLSCMAAIKPGVIIGSAPDAYYWLFRTEEGASETPTEEYNWIRAAELADSIGVDMITTSLGYTTFDNPAQNHNYATLNGKTAPMSIAANLAARKGIFVVNAAGNEGQSFWQYISVPADADSICTVGAVDTLGAIGAFSSVGPTSDGRIKPDLVARGVNTYVDFGNGLTGQGSGTSFAAPVLAGAIACFWQGQRSFDNMKVLNTLRNTASNALMPNNSIGWGIPDMCAIPVGFNQTPFNITSVNMYPNPFNNMLKIEWDYSSYNVQKIELTDVCGKLLFSVEPSAHKNIQTLQLNELNKGFYLVTLYTSSGTLTKKVIKE